MSVSLLERKTLADLYATAYDSAERIRVKYNGKTAEMTAEETGQWAKFLDEADGVKAKLDLLDREIKGRAWMNAPQGGLALADGNAGATKGQGGQGTDDATAKKAVKAAWDSYWRGVNVAQMHPDAIKALAAQEGDLGGFLVIPQQLSEHLLEIVKDILFIRQLATVIPLVHAESLGVVALDTDLGDPTWTSELDTGAEDLTAPFSKRQLVPHPVARLVKISNKLMRASTMDPEDIVMRRLAYRLQRVQENAFLNGTGQDQPLGVFVASANGIDTSRDTVAASSTALAGDDFIGTKHNLKPQYWAKASWTFHRLTLAAIRKLKDTSGNYIWQPGLGGYVAQGTALIGANPETVVGFPYHVSELAPSTFATGLYTAVLGDWSFFWIADALDMQVQRLIELYARSNQTGFIIRAECDGMPVLAEAWQRIRML